MTNLRSIITTIEESGVPFRLLFRAWRGKYKFVSGEIITQSDYAQLAQRFAAPAASLVSAISDSNSKRNRIRARAKEQ